MAKLVNIVGPILDPYPILGIDFPCHSATLYWLCQAQLDRAATVDEMSYASVIIGKLVPFGQPLLRPLGNFSARPGTVLVFADDQGNPKHSCIAISDTVLGGYNQENWFAMSDFKSANRYTTFLQTQIRWKSPSRVQGNTLASSYQLIGIDEASALGNLQTAITQGMSKAPKKA
jgi:hypothetical protein